MDAPIRDARIPDESLPSTLTVQEAVTRWRESRDTQEGRYWPEPLLAAGERHGVMPQPPHRRVRRPRD